LEAAPGPALRQRPFRPERQRADHDRGAGEGGGEAHLPPLSRNGTHGDQPGSDRQVAGVHQDDLGGGETVSAITLLGSARRACSGPTRRETLKVGALSLLGGLFNTRSLIAFENSARQPLQPARANSLVLR